MIFVICLIFNNYNLNLNLGEDFNLIDAFNTIGTLISGLGLIFFSYYTFTNQKNTEFENLFQILLNEHNRLIENHNFTKEVKELNIQVINLIRKYNFKYPDDINIYENLLDKLQKIKNINNIQKITELRNATKSLYYENNGKKELDTNHELYHHFYQIYRNRNEQDFSIVHRDAKEAIRIINNYFQDEKIDDNFNQFKEDLAILINKNNVVKPYLIILFRLLKHISKTNKISEEDKKEYFSLVRGLIPSNVLFLILFNSPAWSNKSNQSTTYESLLKNAKLFEHLNFHQDWLEQAYPNEHIPRIDIVKILEKISVKIIDKQAFGKSIYLPQNK